jgi:hypothetical protein
MFMRQIFWPRVFVVWVAAAFTDNAGSHIETISYWYSVENEIIRQFNRVVRSNAFSGAVILRHTF